MVASGTAYLVQPDEGPGPGVLVLHSWWGLTLEMKRITERLADSGFTALAVDFYGGRLPTTSIDAEAALFELDTNAAADLVLSSPVSLRAYSADPQAPIGVIGFSMGASWALWLATRLPTDVGAVVSYYGTQNLDFEDLIAPVLAHFAENDELVSDDDRTEMHARLLLSDRSVEVHDYPGTRHWFAEQTPAETFESVAAELSWARTIEFLRHNLEMHKAQR